MLHRKYTRRPAALIATLAWTVLCAVPALAEPLDATFDAFVEHSRAAYAVPGAVVVIVRPDRVVMVKGFGVRQAGAPGAVDKNTRFQIASVSKFLTATAIARLADWGRVSWDVPVSKFAPDVVLSVPYATENATLRDYFAHRTGLPAYGGDLLHQLGYSAAEIVQRARYLPFGQSFRERWAYSNYGIFLGQAAAAEAAHMTPAALISDVLLGPLGMTRSGSMLDTMLGDDNFSAAHNLDGTPMPFENVNGFSGAGSVVSTGADLGRWMRILLGNGMLDGNRFLSAAAIQTIFAASMVQGPGGPLGDPNAAAGLGCESYQFLGTRVIEKNGALNGVRTIVTLIPERGIGIAVLANKQMTVFPEAVRAEFLERELGRTTIDLQATIRGEQPAWEGLLKVASAPADATAPTHPLESFAGNYVSAVYGPISIERVGDALEASIGPARYAGQLSHWSGDTFVLTFPNPDTAPGLLTFQFGTGPSATSIVGQSQPGALMANYGRFERPTAP